MTGRWRARPGIVVHRGELPADEVTSLGGIRVTTVPRTIFDLAAVTEGRHVERVLREAEYRRLTDPLSLEDLLERYPRRKGSGVIRSLLAERSIGVAMTRSDLEDLFLSFLDAHSLPRPLVNMGIQVNGRWFEVDCLWRRPRLIVELDSRTAHGTARAFEADRERDRILHAAGWRVIRITWRQLHHAPDQVAADLQALLARRVHP